MEDLSPKSKVMMEYMKKLEEEIEKLGGASKVEHNLGGMEKSPTLPQSPTRRIRKREKRNSLEGTKFVRRGVHPSKATNKRM
ncbi:hypothetical protein CR513_38923, partial [Mucuna pruriens]